MNPPKAKIIPFPYPDGRNPKVKRNSLRAVLLAMRLQTLPGAAITVIIPTALAFADISRTGLADSFRWLPALLCLLFALTMQVNANLINDYLDAKRGFDSAERKGNKRASSQGWLTPRFMKGLILATNLVAAAAGLPLMLFGNWQVLLAVGVLCMLFSLLYTTFFSSRALGDLLVLLFFGIVPVCTTYYILTGTLTPTAFLASLACGFEIDSMLVINNFRDHDEDLRTGKRTLSHVIGRQNMLRYFRAIGYIVCMLGAAYYLAGYRMALYLQIFYLINHQKRSRALETIWQGPQLNSQLAANGKNILLYGLLTAAGLLLSVL